MKSVSPGGCLLQWLTTTGLLAMLTWSCRAQVTDEGGFIVTLRIGSSNRSSAILPDETETIVIVTQLNITLVTAPQDYFMDTSDTCRGNVCTLKFDPFLAAPTSMLTIMLLNSQNMNQTLTLAIRESLNATCAEYNFPMAFTTNTDLYTFTCEPLTLGQNKTDSEVVWRQFRLHRDLERFLEEDILEGEDMSTITNSSNGVFGVSEDGRILTVNNSVDSDANSVAFYYLPSLQTGEILGGETVIFLSPIIMGEVPEFSFEVLFNSRNFSDIKCETDTFPPSTVSWVLVNEEYPCEVDREGCGVDVASLTSTLNFSFIDSGSSQNLTLTMGAILQMLNLQYNQDGNFTCTADNGYAVASRSFNLRVKSPLRPLWPALGIIAVILLVSILMLFSFTVEKVVERKQLHGSRSLTSSPDHADQDLRESVSSAAGQSNSRGRNHSAVKRLSSAKPLLDESTL